MTINSSYLLSLHSSFLVSEFYETLNTFSLLSVLYCLYSPYLKTNPECVEAFEKGAQNYAKVNREIANRLSGGLSDVILSLKKKRKKNVTQKNIHASFLCQQFWSLFNVVF